MGSYKDGSTDTDPNNYSHQRFQRILQPWIACLASFSVSISGGLLLTWWELRYHPTNSQLWMVPFGLIFFITPLVIWSSLCVSYLFSNTGCNTSLAPGEGDSLRLRSFQSDDIP